LAELPTCKSTLSRGEGAGGRDIPARTSADGGEPVTRESNMSAPTATTPVKKMREAQVAMRR